MQGTIMRGAIDSFAEDMKKMVDNQEMSDVVFLVGADCTQIYGHYMHLSARCQVLKAKIAEAFNQKSQPAGVVTVTFEDMAPDIFRAVLEFIYTNRVTLNDSNAIAVLGRSLEFDLGELTELCNRYLIDNLGVENACNALQAAVTYKQSELRKKSLKFIEDQTMDTFKTQAFHNLTSEALSIILESDLLEIDELDAIEAVREWAEVNKVLANKSVEEVTIEVSTRLRLPLLDVDELEEVERDCGKDKLISVSHIGVAWKCHVKKLPEDRSLITCRKGTKYRDHHEKYE